MAAIDTERFRLRRFVERLVQLGECEVHDQPIDLIDVGAVLDGNPRATWFKAVGPEKAELIGNVMGSRKRLALALDTDETRAARRDHRTARQSAQAGEGRGQGRAGAAGGAERRGGRSLRAAGASAARRGRRALYLRRPRRHAVPRQRPHQHRLPPHHAARAAHRRHRHDRAERRARDLSRSGGEGREDAGRLCGRLDAVRFHGGGLHEPADGRAGGAGRAARRAGADRQMRHQRHLRAGRRRIRAGGLSRSQGPRRAGRSVTANTSAITAW